VAYVVRKGVPEILELWKRLLKEYKQGTIGTEDRDLFKKWSKAIAQLRDNPKYPGLQSHEIDDLTRRFGQKVFQSYLENNTPAAGRMFWVYGPEEGQISVIGLEPHPEDRKNKGYARVRLSRMPPPDPPIAQKSRKRHRP
jgi:hypothetical protein